MFDYYWISHLEPAELTECEQRLIEEIELWSANLRELAD